MESVPGADAPVTYLLSSRVSLEGRVSITLKLYRGNQVALTTSVATVDLHQSADVMQKCRQHLSRRGLQKLASYRPKPTEAPAETASLPRASRLFQRFG